MKAIILRYFNAAGAAIDWSLGEDHSPETHLIPLAIEAALNSEQKLSIFGNDYPTPDGTCIRDYIHVADLARAHWLAIKKAKNIDGVLSLNLGTGKGHSINEIIKTIENIIGQKVNFLVKERRAGDPPILIASPEKAEKELQWSTIYSDLPRIINDALQWRLSLDKINN